MKQFVLLALVLTSAYCQTIQEQKFTYLNEFQGYVTKFGKTYSAEEFDQRLESYVYNKLEVERLNEKFSESVQFEVNKFSDLSKEEFRNKILMRATLQTPENEPTNFAPYIKSETQLAENFDWKNATSPVKDQGSCGSCWAFSVAQDIEARWFLATGQKKNLSIEQIIECDGLDYACYGGWTYNALQYVIDNGGLAEESSYPYNVDNHVICLKNQTFNETCPVAPNDPPCTFYCDLTCKETGYQKVAKIASYQRIPQDEEQMKEYLVKYGPYSIALDADGLQSYKSGIYKGGWLGCGDSINHAVLLVGYGTENGVDYWLVKNSWGTGWGEQGYFRIQRGKNMCAIKTYPMFSVVGQQEENKMVYA